MSEQKNLAEPFEQNRAHLRGVAFRLLGSLSEADDAVQEAWLRLSRSGGDDIADLRAWLTTVVARVCLDMLRSRKSRREDSLATTAVPEASVQGPDQEAALAESVGLALLVVLEALDPPERLAFVLHDLLAVPFEEIATIVGRTPAAARQLASRARRRVQGAPAISEPELARKRAVVDAFLVALRAGDFSALVAVLDPEVSVRVDGGPLESKRAVDWAKGAVHFSRSAQFVRVALVDGDVGLVWVPGGRLQRALRVLVVGAKIAGVEVVADPELVRALEVAMLPDIR